MIVNNFDEAKPIVLAAIAQGKKIGQWSMSGKIHDGYRYLANYMRPLCDFSICVCPYTRDENDNEFRLPQLAWGVSLSTIKCKTADQNSLREAESLSDLVILSSRPNPPSDEIEYYKQWADDNYNAYLKDIYAEFNPTTKYSDGIVSGYMVSLKYVLDNYFPIHVRVSSWKEGIWRLAQEVVLKNVLGIDFHLIPPLRRDGIIIGDEIDTPEFREFALFVKNNGLVDASCNTREALEAKLLNIGWTVCSFQHYKGDILKHFTEKGTDFIYFSVKETCATKTAAFPCGSYYSDAVFIR